MNEVSVTVTVGEGSEMHNHDLYYRETLSHVHSRPDGVVELIPYRNYADAIDAAMKPYIDAYNARVEERYQDAWERYNSGQIKTKPRKRDFQKMSDYYFRDHLGEMHRNPHTGKVEEVDPFRSIILGIGDRQDRQSGKISEEQAKAIFTEVAMQFQEHFPDFLLLGATLHLDEEGFYHAHFDYKPIYEKAVPDAEKGKVRRGLDVGTGHDAALEHMGFKPEQSIINGRDKAPLLFNAFRNEVYRMMEAAMAKHDLRLQYGVSQRKEPEKDSSRNQKLESWQAIQDKARELQHEKNVALDVLSQDTVSPEGYKAALEAVQRIEDTLTDVEASKVATFRNGRIITFSLFDQLKSLVKNLRESVVYLVHRAEALAKELDLYKPFKEKYDKLTSEHNKLKEKHENLERFHETFVADTKKFKDKHNRLDLQNHLKDELLVMGEYKGRNLMEIYNEQWAKIEERERQREVLNRIQALKRPLTVEEVKAMVAAERALKEASEGRQEPARQPRRERDPRA